MIEADGLREHAIGSPVPGSRKIWYFCAGMNTSGDVAAKLTQIEEQPELAIKEYPGRIAIDRLKLALALARFCHTELHIESSGIRSVPKITAIRTTDK